MHEPAPLYASRQPLKIQQTLKNDEMTLLHRRSRSFFQEPPCNGCWNLPCTILIKLLLLHLLLQTKEKSVGLLRLEVLERGNEPLCVRRPPRCKIKTVRDVQCASEKSKRRRRKEKAGRAPRHECV